MPPIHSKKPKAMTMCAHGGPMQCNMGCYAKGGSVENKNGETGHEKGVHVAGRAGQFGGGTSHAGMNVRQGQAYQTGEGSLPYRKHLEDLAKNKHKSKLDELRSMKGPHGNYADGGDVEPMKDPMDEHDGAEHEISEALVDELMTAMEHKDHKQVREALEAIVMNCLSKGGM